MRRRNDRIQWTEGRARRELEGWRRSGESMAAYARTRGYPAHRLSWWKWRLAGKEAVETATVALAPAVVTGLAATHRSPVVVSIAPDEVRVEIEDPAAVHPAWVAELASALRRGESA